MLAQAVEAERGAPPVRPIHTAVAGRARLHVAGLRQSPDIKRRLERGLKSAAGIRDVAVSTVTSNVLVQFDPAIPLGRIVQRVAATLQDDPLRDEPPRDEPPVGDEPGGKPRRAASQTTAWHAMEVDDVAVRLDTSAAGGLTGPEARTRLAAHGRNALLPAAARSRLAMMVEQFQTLPVGLLAVAAGVSLLTGGVAFEAAAIFAVIGLNAAIGYVTESRTERTIRGLSQTGHPAARVVRGGQPIEIAAADVVPGDLLLLQRGSLIPADARVISARDLTVSEALLTGESLPVTKTVSPLAARVSLADRVNLVYRGTVVTGGSGAALVVATGAHTEAGRIQQLIAAAGTPETPIQRQLGELGRQLVWLSAAICGGVFGIGVLRGLAMLQVFRSAVSLAVAAIPEGLPTVATTTLALGVEEMRRRDVLVRRLDAVETLAAVDVICFDKTGTVTLNEMAVARIVCGTADTARDPGTLDRRVEKLLEIGVLCSETTVDENGGPGLRLDGTSTEKALVEHALSAGIDVLALRRAHPTLAVRQRTEAYRFMATVHAPAGAGAPDGAMLVTVKGSPSEVLARCRWELQADGRRRALTPARRAAIERTNAEMAEAALRVLGFACQALDAAGALSPAELPIENLIWVGLAGLADPVRPGMRELMATFHRAGIRTVLVTGDQAATARTVARELGLSAGGDIETLDAADFESLTPDELSRAAGRAHVFARVSPGQKLQIVQALQRAGSTVAMTGDGVNDGPALKAAEIGVALGRRGADAAREVADVLLETDDLAVLAFAVEQGRTTHANIRKSIHYLLSTNLSEIFVVFAATAAGAGDALLPMQLLWINLISDVLPGIALACEPPRAGALERGPIPAGEAIVRRDEFGTLAAEGAIIGAGALAAAAYGALRYGAVSAEARTMTFTSLVIGQMLHALTCRNGGPAERLGGPSPVLPNRLLTGTLTLSFAAQAAALVVPGIRGLLGVAPIGPLDAAVAIAGGVLPYLLNGAVKERGRRPRPAASQITAASSRAAERSTT